MTTIIGPEEALKVYADSDCLHNFSDVEAALDRMATAIKDKLAGSNPLVLCIMQGGLIVTGKLLPRLDFPLQVDYIHATRYAGTTCGGEIRWIVKPSDAIKGRTVLLVDDILDEGVTLAAIIEDCKARGAHAVYSAVLVNKRHGRKSDMMADFTGMEVEDRYVFGYGMDYKSYLRNVPGIYAVKVKKDA